MMKKATLFWLSVCGLALTLFPNPSTAKPDLLVSGILVLDDDFIAIRIENAAEAEVAVAEELRTKSFLTIFINGVNRAEYRFKYVDPTVFRKRSLVLVRTNFRAVSGLTVKAVVDPEAVIPETNELNNAREKTFAANAR